MSVYVLKLSNDEEIIAEFDHELTDDVNEFVCTHPMSVIGMREDTPYGGGMRLRNALVLSDSTTLTLRARFVMAWYEPGVAMRKYYQAAVDYNLSYSKDTVDGQIQKAATELSESIKELKGEGDTDVDDAMEEFARIMGAKSPPNNKLN